jgi:general secretion pathway protein L
MSQRILGIDIGSYSIKVAELERGYRDFHLIGFFEQPILSQEALGREGATTQALIKLFEEYNLPRDQIYTSLPGQTSSLRVIDLPFADFKKVDATIEFEMENYLPLPIEEMLIDYQLLKTTKTSSNVLVSYCKKSEFVKFMNMLTGADLDPRYIGSEPVEMGNLLKLGVLQPEGAYAIIDMGHEKTDVVIFSGAELQYARTIFFGGRDVTSAIAESLKIPSNEADQMKIEMGHLGPETDGADATTRAVNEAIKTALNEFMLHLRQTFMAFQESKGEMVQALVLCGGSSRLPGIDHYFSSELRKNVSFLDCLDFPFNQLADSDWCRPVAASALAVAYRGVIGSSIRNIQFRRGEFAYKGEVKEITSLVKQVGFMLGITLLFAFTSFGLSYATLKNRAKSQIAKISILAQQALPDLPKKTLSSPNAILSTLTGKVTEAEEKQKKISDELEVSVLDALKELSTAVPPRESVVLDIDDLTIISRKIRIQGRTNSFEAVDEIKSALAKSKLFKNVATENVRKGLKDEVRFNLSIDLADEPEPGKEG